MAQLRTLPSASRWRSRSSKASAWLPWDDCAAGSDCGAAYVFDLNQLNQPPDCASAAPGQVTLWPPNHKFVAISIQGVTDPEGDAITLAISSIFQDEPVDTIDEDGELHVPDGQGLGTATAEVRAERDEAGNGRVYHIRFTANDGQGGACTGTVKVAVPRQVNGTAVDGGPNFDSTITP